METSLHKISNEYTAPNKVTLIPAGKTFFQLLEKRIREATDTIHLQVYIFSNDFTGRQVANALKEAAGRNVRVFLLADGYASQSLPKSFIRELEGAGINFRFFEPVFKSRFFYFGRRLHHKIAVFDTKYALVGGINIADRYNDLPGQTAWLDFALEAEGAVVPGLCNLCWKTWNGFRRNIPLPDCLENPDDLQIPSAESSSVRMRRNDWVRRKNEITATYVSMLRGSEREVMILGSYFLPGRVIRKQIMYALKRGVQISVVTAGRTDVLLSKFAERWLYDWLLRAGVAVYEYQGNILHGKLAVCDEKWMTIGSYNINNISTYASIELNLDVRNEFFARAVRTRLENIIEQDCIRITPTELRKKKNIFSQLLHWFSYQFIRTVFYLFTFYFKHLN